MMTKRKFHLSLRWKWGWLLTGSFMILYFLVSASMILLLKHNEFQSEKVIVDKSVQNILSFLNSDQGRLSKLSDYGHFFQQTNRSNAYHYLAATYEREGISDRILDHTGNVVYETKEFPNLPLSLEKIGDANVLIHNNKEIIVTTEVLVDDHHNRLGYIQLVFTLSNYHKRMFEMYNNYTFVSLVAVILCGLFGHIIAHYFFIPIQHMTQIMASLKEEAEDKKRMDLSKRRADELTDLSVGFNDLLDTMDLYINQQKQFVEDVSHELRTPVAIVEGHLQLLNRWGKSDPQILDESLSASLNEIGRMKKLVQEMLDLSRAEQVGIHYNNEVTELLSLIYQIHQNFVIIYEDFQFNLEIDMDKSQEVYVSISRHHLEQVLIILLDNAVKYSTDKLYIHISVARTVNHVQISIQDFGEGISEEDLAKVFGRFYRVDKARSRYKGGNGLGLSIAKELIEGYKGKIHAESVINNGSIFRIELPIIVDEFRLEQVKRKIINKGG